MENNYKKGYVYTYTWVTFLYSRDWHNIVNQVYFNLKKTKNRVVPKLLASVQKEKYLPELA